MIILGHEVEDLPEGIFVSDVIILVKALDDEGDPAVYTRTSTGINEMERYAMLDIEANRIRQNFLKAFEEGDGT